MTVHTVELAQPQPVHRSFRLTRPGAKVALESHVRPALGMFGAGIAGLAWCLAWSDPIILNPTDGSWLPPTIEPR